MYLFMYYLFNTVRPPNAVSTPVVSPVPPIVDAQGAQPMEQEVAPDRNPLLVSSLF